MISLLKRRVRLCWACMQSGDALRGEIEQLVELVASKRMAFGRALHLDEAAADIHHHVHVRFGAGVLGVVQVEHGHAAVDAHRDGGDLPVHRIGARGRAAS